MASASLFHKNVYRLIHDLQVIWIAESRNTMRRVHIRDAGLRLNTDADLP